MTHIIFKAGKSSTLAHYRKCTPAAAPVSGGEDMMALEDLVHVEGLEETGPGGKAVHLVGIGWVIREFNPLCDGRRSSVGLTLGSCLMGQAARRRRSG